MYPFGSLLTITYRHLPHWQRIYKSLYYSLPSLPKIKMSSQIWKWKQIQLNFFLEIVVVLTKLLFFFFYCSSDYVGSVIIRDPRAWHGGTPNLSSMRRYLPNIEYYSSWFRFHRGQQMTPSMPKSIYDNLSEFGKKLCKAILVPPGMFNINGSQQKEFIGAETPKELVTSSDNQ